MNLYKHPLHYLLATLAVGSFALELLLAAQPIAHGQDPGNPLAFPDASGMVATLSTNGSLDIHNPFFQSIGTNGRACVTCHVPADAWSITPRHLQARFEATDGLDPIFRTKDGTNSPNADMSTLAARRDACSMLLSKGLIRIGLGIPDDAEFTLDDVDDPYGYASQTELSLFRRPLPTTNLRFLSGVMWDGRESPPDRSLEENLLSQASDATTGHAQASAPPSAKQLQAIVRFETGLYTAQIVDQTAGSLQALGATGGPGLLWQQEFFLGINDPVGLNPTGAAFDPVVFTLYAPWSVLKDKDPRSEARRAIARGEQLFNTKPITLTNVGGLNDRLGQPSIQGTCTLCHDSPNVGNHSVVFPLNIGLTDAARRTPDMPLYTLRNRRTAETIQTTDPGRALISGKWSDIGKFKGPILRGLAARPPYFHNGSAATLEEAVDFYDTRFSIGFTVQEKADLVAFLRSL